VINQAIKQESVFITEEQGRTIECTEKQGFWRFAQEIFQTSREAQPLVYSVDLIALPCSYRGRDACHHTPPAQIPAGGFPAPGSHLGCLTARRLFLAACRTRSSPWVMLSRLGVRRMPCSIVFPSAPPLGSTNSADSFPPLFAGFIATMEGSDPSCPCITGYGPPAFPVRTRANSTQARHKVSRFPNKRFRRRARVSDHAGPAGHWR